MTFHITLCWCVLWHASDILMSMSREKWCWYIFDALFLMHSHIRWMKSVKGNCQVIWSIFLCSMRFIRYIPNYHSTLCSDNDAECRWHTILIHNMRYINSKHVNFAIKSLTNTKLLAMPKITRVLWRTLSGIFCIWMLNVLKMCIMCSEGCCERHNI